MRLGMRAGTLLWLSLGLSLGLCSGQETSIPLAEVAERSAKLALDLRAMNARSSAEGPSREIEGSIRDFSAAVQSLRNYSKEVLAEKSAGSGALELQSTWRPALSRLTQWQTSLRERAKLLSQDRDSLQAALLLWEKTLQSPAMSDAPAELANRIRTNLAAIRQSEGLTRAQLQKVLLLLDQLSDVQVEADAIKEEIQKRAELDRLGLFSFDSAPLWKLPALARAASHPARSGPALNEDSAQWVREQARLILARLIIFLVLLVAIALALRFLRRRLVRSGQAESSAMDALRLILQRPWSAACFLALFVSALVQRGVPPALISLAGLILVVPSLRLLPNLIGSHLHWPFYGLFLLILAAELVAYIPAGAWASRASWLGVQILAMGFYASLGVFLRRRNMPGHWPATVRFLTWLSLAFCALSALANLIGMAKLSEFILRSVLLVGYAALLTRGVMAICAELGLLLHRSTRLAALVEARGGREAVERRWMLLFNLMGLVAFLVAALYVTDLLSPFLDVADQILSNSISFGAIQLSLYSVLAFLATVVLSMLLSTILRASMEASVYRRLNWQTGQQEAISKIVHYAVLLLGFFVAVTAAGVSLSNLAVLMGGLSVGLGFGLQNVMNNFVSGVILLFERPLQTGDVISVGSTEGVVRGIGIRASVIRTWDGADVIVPNGQLLSGSLTNWTQSDQSRRYDINIGITYEADPKAVAAILMAVAKANPLVIQEPEPLVLLTKFGDSTLDFTLRYWCHFGDAVRLATELRTAMKAALDQAGIEIPFPTTEVRLHGWMPPAAVEPRTNQPSA